VCLMSDGYVEMDNCAFVATLLSPNDTLNKL
jgi:hypothetical protein